MKMSNMKRGQRVRLKSKHELYYGTDKHGKPFAFAPAGAVGVIGAVDVPPVVGNRGNFCCVDFESDQCEFDFTAELSPVQAAASMWRAAVRPDQFEPV